MKRVTLSLTLVLLTVIAVAIIRHKTVDDNIISYIVDPKVQDIRFGTVLAPPDTSSGNGNFYLKPNGVLYITKDGKAVICTTPDFKYNKQIAYATQSGPMLLINGDIHPAFKKGSTNLNLRSGVGLLPDNRLVFAMSRTGADINFYDFADYFKRLGCKNALYLDGFVSRMYLPAQQWEQTDGNFGVIIGVSEPE